MSESGLTAERPDGERGAVFISYSRGDREFVQRLRDGLTARGHPCWVDWQGIRPTASWMDEVRAAIDAAPAFVFVASPASVDSEVCLEEIDHADKVRKRFLPIVRGEVDADGLPDPIASRHWISMRPEDDFDQALGELVVALDTEPKWAAAHTRLLLRAAEWDRNGRDSSFALRGRDLATAERWLTEADERKDPQPARLHTEYIIASRRAATRSQRIRMAALGAGLLVTAALAVYATIQRSHADERAREARSRELAARALLNRASDPEVGLLYAVEAARIDQTPEAELAMRQLLPKSHATAVFSAGGAAIKNAVLSPNGRLAATVSEGGVARIWDVRSGRVTQRLELGSGLATDVAFNQRGSELLTAAVRGSVTLWNVRSGTRVRVFQGLAGVVESAEFSPDGELVVAGGTDGGRVWKVEEPRQPLSTLSGDQGTVWGVSFSPDGRRVVSAGPTAR